MNTQKEEARNKIANVMRNVIDSDLSVDEKVNACVTHTLEAVQAHDRKLAEEIREEFIKIAIKGKEDRDEFKGAMLFSRFIDFLEKQKEEV